MVKHADLIAYTHISDQIRALEKEKARVKSQIVADMLGEEKVDAHGYRIINATVERSYFDISAARDNHPDLIERFTEMRPQTRFSITVPKPKG